MACPFASSVTPNSGEGEDKDNLSYTKYLQLKPLLSITLPRSNVHDEHLFILVHQVYELWFKQIIHELDSIRNIFMQPVVDDRHMLIVNSRLGRITKILAILVEQIKILETMTPLDFADFRGDLKTSSGFQSWQFRLLENKLGVKKENRINYNNNDYSAAFKQNEELYNLVQDSEEEPSIFDLVEAWLERTPGLKTENFDFSKQFAGNCFKWFKDEQAAAENEKDPMKRDQMLSCCAKTQSDFEQILVKEKYEVLRQKEPLHVVICQNSGKRGTGIEVETCHHVLITFFMIEDARDYESLNNEQSSMNILGDRRLSWKALQGALMIYYYRDEVVFHEPFQMIALLMDIDSLITKWRSNHVLLVQRQLGTKSGTGGSSGYMYLRSTVSDRYKAFLDFFNLSNYLVPRKYIPELNIAARKHLVKVVMPTFEYKEEFVLK